MRRALPLVGRFITRAANATRYKRNGVERINIAHEYDDLCMLKHLIFLLVPNSI